MQDLSVGQDHLEPDATIGGSMVNARAPKQTVLGERSSNRRIHPRKRSVIWSSDPARLERLVELFPRASGLNRDIHIVGVDFDDAVHASHVDKHRLVTLRDVASRVRHAAATGHQGIACRSD